MEDGDGGGGEGKEGMGRKMMVAERQIRSTRGHGLADRFSAS